MPSATRDNEQGSWSGAARCWYNPRTRETISVGPGEHPDHVECFQDFADPVSHARLLRLLPDLDLSDYPDPVDVYDVYFGMDLHNVLGEDNMRILPVMLGWVCVNCDPAITSLPYLLARDKQDALKCLRWLESKGVHPADHPDFSAETYSMEGGKVTYRAYRYDGGRLLPRDEPALMPGMTP